jgi:hypothetical protein
MKKAVAATSLAAQYHPRRESQIVAIILIPATKSTNDKRFCIVELPNRLLPYSEPM